MAASESPHIISSEATVVTAGTAVALAASGRAKSVTIRAKSTNTTRVYVGGSDVDKDSPPNEGLAAGESVTFDAVGWMSLDEVYVDAATSGEGVDFYAVKA